MTRSDGRRAKFVEKLQQAEEKAKAQGLAVPKLGELRKVEDREEELRRVLRKGEGSKELLTRGWLEQNTRGRGSVIRAILRGLIDKGEVKEFILPWDIHEGKTSKRARPVIYLPSYTNSEFYFEGVRERMGLPLRKGNG